MTEASFSGGKAAAHAAFSKSLSAISEYVAPAGGALAGFFVGPGALGGQNSVFHLLQTSFPSASGTTLSRVGNLVMAIIAAGIGGLFWGLRHSGGLWMSLLGGIVGGFFLGTAAAYGVGALTGQGTTSKNGLIDAFVSGTQQVASGG